MEVRSCKMCKGLFNYLGGRPLCPKCIAALEDKFQDVKQYVIDNPNASISEVAEENEVPISQIKQWIREERLSFSKDSVVGIECESCGAMIKTGRFCDSCKNKLHSGLENAIKKPEPVREVKKKEDPRMRFLDGR